MKRKISKMILSLALAALVALLPARPLLEARDARQTAADATARAVVESKDEVIYATLAADGRVRAAYAVNHFALAQAGSLMDFGEYLSVTNLTDTTPLTYQGKLVGIPSAAEHFYYQGNLATTDLPWLIDLAYTLDGAPVAPAELAGRAGALEIAVRTRQNKAVNAAFYDSYMLQVSLTLDTEKCSDIQAAGATLASAGKSQVVAFTVMPGRDAELLLTATVRDFTMSGIEITALPFAVAMDLPDLDGMIGDFAELTDAIAALDEGVGKLAVGVASLETGLGALREGSADIDAGLGQLRAQSGTLSGAAAQIGAALSQIAAAVGGALGELDLADLAALPAGLSQLAEGLEGVAGGLTALGAGFAPAYAALDGAIGDLPDPLLGPEQIGALYAATDPSQYAVLEQLVDAYTAGQIVKGTYGQVQGAFAAVAPTLETLNAGIGTIAATLRAIADQAGAALAGMDGLAQLEQLATGLATLDANYGDFQQGLESYLDGVSALADGYGDFHLGLTEAVGGAGTLRDGAQTLHDGSATLAKETAGMPETLQAEIDALLDPYTGADYQPVSFTSPWNTDTTLVQFVMRSEGIEKPEKPQNGETAPAHETMWDRLLALFKSKKAS